ncbi:MAG TPA: DUF4976 domain-containing protein, partial [Planctomycetaceae bacterium]|nr:DUF4976 domain-containing protein [Planctomycetaceae bacterium]
WELYDLQQDPKELRSVYGDPRYSQVQKRLLAELARLRTELKVPDPDPPQSYRGGMKRYQRALEKVRQRRKELGLD